MTNQTMTVCPTAPPPSKAPPTEATPPPEATPPFTEAPPSIMATPPTEATPTPMVVVVKTEARNSCCGCDFSGSIPLPGLTGISIAQIILSAAVLFTEILNLKVNGRHYNGVVGVWTSIFICIAGVSGICAAKKTNKCTVQFYLVLSIVSICCSVALVIGTGSVIDRYESFNMDVAKTFNCIMLTFGLVQLALALSGAIISFRAVCERENKVSDQVVYLPNGQNGPIWRRELNWQSGPNGQSGTNGQSGPNIQNGPNGQIGPNGQNGPNGQIGTNGYFYGPNGQNGPNWQSGPNGQSGPNIQIGPNGQSGPHGHLYETNGQSGPIRQNGPNWQSLVNWHYDQSGPNGQSGPPEMRPGAHMMGDKPGNLRY